MFCEFIESNLVSCVLFDLQQGSPAVRTIGNKQYNTPVAIYSDESIAESLSSQAEVLAGGVLG